MHIVEVNLLDFFGILSC